MNPRCFALLCALTIPAVFLVPVAGQAPAAGKTPAAAPKSSMPPRTPWGDPDLQGVYNYATTVPLERPREHAGREVLTSEEAAARLRSRVDAQDAAPREGDPGTYNAFWRDLVDLTAWGLVATRTSLIVDPPDGAIPPLTPAAQKKIEGTRADDAERAARNTGAASPRSWEDFPLGTRCILWGVAGPPMAPGPYNNNMQLIQGPGYVAILNEMIHEVRMIPLSGLPPAPSTVRLWMGDSRGRWEGETLVVETTNFIPHFQRTSENMKLIERFARVDDNTLRYEFTVVDPDVYTRPWTAQVPMTKVKGQLYEYACHEGNYAMSNALNAGRVADKAAAQAPKTGAR